MPSLTELLTACCRRDAEEYTLNQSDRAAAARNTCYWCRPMTTMASNLRTNKRFPVVLRASAAPEEKTDRRTAHEYEWRASAVAARRRRWRQAWWRLWRSSGRLWAARGALSGPDPPGPNRPRLNGVPSPFIKTARPAGPRLCREGTKRRLKFVPSTSVPAVNKHRKIDVRADKGL